MKALMTLALLASFATVMAGCEASGSIGTDSDNGSKHTVEQKKTVTDPNGNVIQHSETKTEEKTNP